MEGTNADRALQPSQTDLITLIWREFAALKASFKTELQGEILEAIKPLSEKLEVLTFVVPSITKTAEKALELSMTALSEIKTVHVGEDTLFEQLTVLDQIQRQNNLKTRGIFEDAGGNVVLVDLMSDWLANELCLDQGSTIIITKAFRMGVKEAKDFIGGKAA